MNTQEKLAYLEKNSIFGEYKDILVEEWGEEKTTVFLRQFEDPVSCGSCKGCGGCCLAFLFPLASRYGKCNLLDEETTEDDGYSIINYVCRDYESRGLGCMFYERRKTDSGLGCYPLVPRADDRRAADVLDLLYFRTDISFSERISRAVDIVGLNSLDILFFHTRITRVWLSKIFDFNSGTWRFSLDNPED